MGLVLVLVFVLLVFVRPSQVRSGQERKGKVKSGAHVWRFDIPRPLFEDTASTDGKRCWIFLFFYVYIILVITCMDVIVRILDVTIFSVRCYAMRYYAMLCFCIYFYLSLSKFMSLYISHECVC